MSMTAEKLGDIKHEEDLDLSGYDFIRFRIGNKVIRVQEMDGGSLVISQDGQHYIRCVASNWIEIV
jgi:hypothetical protein